MFAGGFEAPITYQPASQPAGLPKLRSVRFIVGISPLLLILSDDDPAFCGGHFALVCLHVHTAEITFISTIAIKTCVCVCVCTKLIKR